MGRYSGDKSDDFAVWFVLVWILAGLVGVGSCSVYALKDFSRCTDVNLGPGPHDLYAYASALVSCGPGLLGVAGIVGGLLGMIAGVGCMALVDRITKPRTTVRNVGRGIAMLIAFGVASLLFVPAFLLQR